LTDFVCLLIYEFWLSLWKIALCSVILLLPLLVKKYQHSRSSCVDLLFLNCVVFVFINWCTEVQTFKFNVRYKTCMSNPLPTHI